MLGNKYIMICSNGKLLLYACIILFVALSSEKCNNSMKGYYFNINSPKWIYERTDSIIEVKTIIVNNSNDTLRYQSEAGGWEDYYLVDNNKLQVDFPRGKFTGDKFMVTLAPGKSRMVYLPLMLKHGFINFHGKFKIGMILKNVHVKLRSNPKQIVLWSNTVEI